MGARLDCEELLLEVFGYRPERLGSRSRGPNASCPKTSERGGRRLFVWVAGTWCMCEVEPRVGLWLTTCRVNGWGWYRPVNVWFSGADWITRSLANCDAEGGTIDRPGGARRLEPLLGMPMKPDSEGLVPSGPSSLADF